VVTRNEGVHFSWTLYHKSSFIWLILTPIILIEANNRANIIRQAIAENFTTFNEEEILVTSSFGVSNVLLEAGEDRYSIPQLIREADQALYAAKHKGRNRVEIYVANEHLVEF